MDGVGTEFILNTNSEIIKPDLQLAVIADEKILQERLSERDVLTRFEKENQSKRELDFMEKGVRELRKHNIDIMNIYNNDNLDENVEKVISYTYTPSLFVKNFILPKEREEGIAVEN